MNCALVRNGSGDSRTIMSHRNVRQVPNGLLVLVQPHLHASKVGAILQDARNTIPPPLIDCRELNPCLHEFVRDSGDGRGREVNYDASSGERGTVNKVDT